MNILYITPNFTIGGTEGQIFNLVLKIDKSKFKPYVMSMGFDYGQREQYSKNGIETRIFALTDFFRIVSFIKEHKIDVVHSFYYGNFSGWELVAAKLAGVKKFITSRRNMGYWRKGRHLVFDIFRNRFTDVIVANSYAVRDKTIVDERLQYSKVVVIYNGIDFARYPDLPDDAVRKSVRAELGIDDSCRTIGMISNIKNIKGYEYFLGAAKAILKEGYKVKFVIAGEGSDEPSFRAIVDKYGLGDAIILLGLCRDVQRLLSGIDIFMYSSISEGFPNIILEAMACGKPIVSTDVGGTAEMIVDGYSGVLVSSRDEKLLAEGAIKLLNDEREARRKGEIAKESAKRLFTMEECVSEYEFLYENLYKEAGR